MLRLNTDYYKVNFQINEGGKYFTFALILFQRAYVEAGATTKGLIRIYLFGKVFTHWFKKR